jgi:hypothetical protein
MELNGSALESASGAPQRQAAARQTVVDSGDPERQDRPSAQRRSLKPLNLLAETTDGG